MKKKYKQLKNKMAFCEMIAGKLKLNTSYVVNSFVTGRIPIVHSEFINRALDIQLSFDNKVEEMQKEVNESIIV